MSVTLTDLKIAIPFGIMNEDQVKDLLNKLNNLKISTSEAEPYFLKLSFSHKLSFDYNDLISYMFVVYQLRPSEMYFLNYGVTDQLSHMCLHWAKPKGSL